MADSTDFQIRTLRTELANLKRQVMAQDEQIHTLIPHVRILQKTVKQLILRLGPPKNGPQKTG